MLKQEDAFQDYKDAPASPSVDETEQTEVPQEVFVTMGDAKVEEGVLVAADNRVKGVKIEAIGAIFSTSDQKELALQLNHLFKIAFKRDIPLAAIYVVGADLPDIKGDNEVMNTIWVLGGSLVSLPTLIAPYDEYVESLPTWILYTGQGQYLLEGVSKPEGYINSRGEFVEGIDQRNKSVRIPEKSEIESHFVQEKSSDVRDPLDAISAARGADSKRARQLVDSLSGAEK